jgi:hypothetical protein
MFAAAAEQTPRPSVRVRVPWSEYRQIPGVSITRLKEMRRSPLHYRHACDHPRSSAAFTLGTAAHCATLEPHLFADTFAVWDEPTDTGRQRPRRGKDWDAFVADNAGKTIITAAEMTTALDIAAAVRSDPAAMRYLERGEPEVTMQWHERGHQCRGRLDWLTCVDGAHVLVGLKTTQDCRPFQFGAAAARLGYHMQWAFYGSGWRHATGGEAATVEIVVEAKPPHAVAVYAIVDDVMEQGRDDYAQLLDRLAECEASGLWPGPVDGEQVLSLPSWAYPSGDDDLADLGLEMDA